MDDDAMIGIPFDDDYLSEKEFDPVEVAICQALYPVLSGVFARELVQTLGG